MMMKGSTFLALFSFLWLLALPKISYPVSASDGFYPNANSDVSSIVVQADGKILVGGEFTTIDEVERKHLARLNPHRSLDTDFNPTEGSNRLQISGLFFA